jgi:hypothetical protein
MQVRLPAALRSGIQRLAREYKCDVAALVVIAAEEMVAAHQRPARRQRKPARRKLVVGSRKPVTVVRQTAAAPLTTAPTDGRTYQPKPCAGCGNPFTPTGARSKRCRGCKAQPTRAERPASEFETVWDGSKGRQGASLTSH